MTLIHTQDTTREQLRRQQLMKWSDGVLSEKWLAKKKSVSTRISGQLQWWGVLQKGRMTFSLDTEQERP